MAKKLSEVLGNFLAPYLAKYLPLSGGTLSNTLYFNIDTSRNQIVFSRNAINYIRSVGDDSQIGIIVGSKGDYYGNSCVVLFKENIFYPGENAATLNGDETHRWANVYTVDGDFLGNITVKGKINGTSVANLISLDDLKEVLSKEQISTLEAKVSKRITVSTLKTQNKEI